MILVGGRQRAVNVYVDTDKLTAYKLSIEDVRQALIRQNLELPGGRVDQGSRELVLRTMGRVDRDGRFLDLIVARPRAAIRCGSRTWAAWKTRSRSRGAWPGSTARTRSA